MSDARPAPNDEDALLRELAEAIRSSQSPVRSIEVGIALSIALGRQRSSVSCGGCTTPLEFNGIPAATNAALSGPFRLVLDPSVPA